MRRQWEGLARKGAVLLAWAAATSLAALITWSAVARLGPGDSTASDPLTQAQVSHALAQQQTSAPRTSSTPPAPTTTTPHPPSQTPTAGSGSSPTTPVNPPPTSPDTTPPPASGTTSSNPPSPPRRSRSWTVNGGDVGASCQGETVALLYATPRDGWSVDPPDQSPTAISVTFTRGDAESTLHVTCHAGIPQATRKESHGSGDNGGGGGEGGGGDGG